MTAGPEPTPLERRDALIKKLDEGHRQLLASLKDLDSEEAFLGSRWSVWEVLQHLDSARFVDALEKLASGETEMLPSFDSRAERLQEDMERIEATYRRLRALAEGLSEEQLARPATPPNPHNSYPGLTLLELLERVAGHEATHARQIELTRKYVAEFSARKRAVTFLGLEKDGTLAISDRVKGLLSYADYTAGPEDALAVVRPWTRGVAVVMHPGNTAEVLARLGREARAGQWTLVCCWGDPEESAADLLAQARRVCDAVVVFLDGSP